MTIADQRYYANIARIAAALERIAKCMENDMAKEEEE